MTTSSFREVVKDTLVSPVHPILIKSSLTENDGKRDVSVIIDRSELISKMMINGGSVDSKLAEP